MTREIMTILALWYAGGCCLMIGGVDLYLNGSRMGCVKYLAFLVAVPAWTWCHFR